MHLVSSVLIKRGTALCNYDVCALNWWNLRRSGGGCRAEAGNGGRGPARAGRAGRPRGGAGEGEGRGPPWPPGASRRARSPSSRYGRAGGLGPAASCRKDAELGGCLNRCCAARSTGLGQRADLPLSLPVPEAAAGPSAVPQDPAGYPRGPCWAGSPLLKGLGQGGVQEK